jgi:hypothetical protein
MAETLADLLIKLKLVTDKGAGEQAAQQIREQWGRIVADMTSTINSGGVGAAFAKLTQGIQASGQAMLDLPLGNTRSGLGSLAAAAAATYAAMELPQKTFGSWLVAAAEMEKVKAELKSMTGDAQLATEQWQTLMKASTSMPFKVEAIQQAAVAIDKFNQPLAKLLPLAGQLAAKVGKDLPGASAALARAWSGDQRSLSMLARQYGITQEKLIELGAATKDGIKVTTSGAEALDKLRGALTAAVQSGDGDAMADQFNTIGGSLTQLHNAVTRVSQTLGEDLDPAFITIVHAVTGVVESFEHLPAPLQALVAYGGAGAAVLGSMAGVAFGLGKVAMVARSQLINLGAGMVGVKAEGMSLRTAWEAIAGGARAAGSSFGAMAKRAATARVTMQGVGTAIRTAVGGGLEAATTAATSAASAIPAALSGVVAAMASVAGVGLSVIAGELIYNETLKQRIANELAEQEAIKKSTQAMAELAKAHQGDWIHKSAQQLAEMGVTVKQVVQTEDALRAEIEATKANTELDTAAKNKRVKALLAELDATRQAATGLQQYITMQRQLGDAMTQAEERLKTAEADLKMHHQTIQRVMTAQAAVVEELKKKVEEAKQTISTDSEADAAKLRQLQDQLLQAQVKLSELQDQVLQKELKGSEQVAERQADLAKLRVEAARQELDEHKRAGVETKADTDAVVEASIAAAARERDAKLHSIEIKTQAEINSGNVSGQTMRAFELEREQAEEAYTQAVRKATDERVKFAQQEAKRRLAAQLEMVGIQMQALHADTARTGTDHAKEVEAEINKQMALKIAAAQAEGGTREEVENKIRIIRAQAHEEVLKAQDEERRFLAERIKLETDAAKSKLDGLAVDRQILDVRRIQGAAVEPLIAAKIREEQQLKLQIAAQDRDAAIQETQDAGKIGTAKLKYAAEVKKINQETEDALRANHQAEMSRIAQRLDAQRSIVHLQQEGTDIQFEQMQKLGQVSDQQLQAYYQKKLQMALEEIKLEEQAQLATEQDQQKRQDIIAEAQLKFSNEKQRLALAYAEALTGQKTTLEQQTAEIKKQNDLRNSPLQSIQDALSSVNLFGNGFSLGGGLMSSGAGTQADQQADLRQKFLESMSTFGRNAPSMEDFMDSLSRPADKALDDARLQTRPQNVEHNVNVSSLTVTVNGDSVHGAKDPKKLKQGLDHIIGGLGLEDHLGGNFNL